MRQRAFIGIALLALSHLTFVNLAPAFAQAGNAGGTIGKQDKSISGGEPADTPRAALHPKQSITKPRETSSGHSCNRIVGTWSWAYGLTEMVFSKNGTVRQTVSGNTGKWSCTGTDVKAVFPASNSIDRMTMSEDGNSLSVTTTWGGGLKFTATRVGQD